MKRSFHAAFVLSALLSFTASAGKIDVAEYAGQALEPEQGVAILRVVWQRESSGGASKTTTRDDQRVYIVLREASGKDKDRYIIEGPETIKAFVLPAGRWYVNEIYTPGNRALPNITKPKQAVLQSFQVTADKINYAGWFTLRLVRDAGGEESFNVSVEFPPDAVKEAGEAFPELFAAKELLYCPVGRACKPPSAFKF